MIEGLGKSFRVGGLTRVQDLHYMFRGCNNYSRHMFYVYVVVFTHVRFHQLLTGVSVEENPRVRARRAQS